MKIMKAVVLSVMMFSAPSLYSGAVWAGEVNINSADVLALSTELTGIGDKKAQAIVDYRKQNGPFTSVEDLQNVKGISSIIIEKNIDNIIL